MTTTIENKTDVYSRPNARFGDDGTLVVRASAVANCRRALWYEANQYPVTNAPAEESLTVLGGGQRSWSRWCCGPCAAPVGTLTPRTGTTPGWSPCVSARRWL